MQKTFKRLMSIKDILWALGIVISLVAVAIGLLFTLFTRYNGASSETVIDFSRIKIVEEGTTPEMPTKKAASVGTLKMLGETSDASESYLDRLTFLCDSTTIGLRDMNLVSGTVLGSEAGTLPMSAVGTWNVKHSDGSKVSPTTVVMTKKPPAIVLMIGSDDLENCTKEIFMNGYQELVSGIQQRSPNTIVICCSIPPVTSAYELGGGISNTRIAEANNWIQQVCIAADAYYCDTASSVTGGTVLMQDYAASDGKTLNIGGLQQILIYLRTHSIAF